MKLLIPFDIFVPKLGGVPNALIVSVFRAVSTFDLAAWFADMPRRWRR